MTDLLLIVEAIYKTVTTPFANYPELTDDERETLRRVIRGQPFSRIGLDMGITKAGVHKRVHRSLAKIQEAGGPVLELQDLTGHALDQIKALAEEGIRSVPR